MGLDWYSSYKLKMFNFPKKVINVTKLEMAVT